MSINTEKWRLAIYRWSSAIPPQKPVEINGRSVNSVPLPAQELNESFVVSFEKVLSSLEHDLDAYVEGDGSFGASGMNDDQTIWKIQGTVFGVDATVRYAEVWLENCQPNVFQTILNSLQLDRDECVIQLMEFGCFVSGAEFFALAFDEESGE